jgi:deoxycytidylate deaminase
MDEYGIAMAFNASVRSIDMSRQVGAAILSKDGAVLAVGCNEVPKFGGGTYWEGDTDDAREASLGLDQNTRRKRLMVTDVVYRLANAGLADERFKKLSVDQLAEELVDQPDGALKNCLVLDTLEFGRMLHAEMCAITEVGRLGIPVKDASLYCTTFPCHNCAKHIVGVGLDEVVYFDPYPKSHVSELYLDSILVDPAIRSKERVVFRQFMGIAPARYYLFSKDRLKDASGVIKEWAPEHANPVSRQVIPQHIELEKFTLVALRSSIQKVYSSDATDGRPSGC